MKFKPWVYQKRMIETILAGESIALWADMGLGKTVTVLTAIEVLTHLGGKTLVLAPKTVADNTWPDEIAKWDHLQDLRVVNIRGTSKERVKLLAQDADVYILCRNLIPWLFKQYTKTVGRRWSWTKEFDFERLVLDESSAFKKSFGGMV